jgi:hypothetical protein
VEKDVRESMEQLAGSPARSWQNYDSQEKEEADFKVFPDFEFKIDPKNFSDNGIIELTAESKLRYCLKLIQSTCGEASDQFSDISHPNVRESQLLAQKKYLGGTISIGKTEAKVHRSVIVDPDAATESLYQKFKENNHPAWQLAKQLENYEEISSNDIDGVKRSLAVIFAWPELRLIYNQQIDEYKKDIQT